MLRFIKWIGSFFTRKEDNFKPTKITEDPVKSSHVKTVNSKQNKSRTSNRPSVAKQKENFGEYAAPASRPQDNSVDNIIMTAVILDAMNNDASTPERTCDTPTYHGGSTGGGCYETTTTSTDSGSTSGSY